MKNFGLLILCVSIIAQISHAEESKTAKQPIGFNFLLLSRQQEASSTYIRLESPYLWNLFFLQGEYGSKDYYSTMGDKRQNLDSSEGSGGIGMTIAGPQTRSQIPFYMNFALRYGCSGYKYAEDSSQRNFNYLETELAIRYLAVFSDSSLAFLPEIGVTDRSNFLKRGQYTAGDFALPRTIIAPYFAIGIGF